MRVWYLVCSHRALLECNFSRPTLHYQLVFFFSETKNENHSCLYVYCIPIAMLSCLQHYAAIIPHQEYYFEVPKRKYQKKMTPPKKSDFFFPLPFFDDGKYFCFLFFEMVVDSHCCSSLLFSPSWQRGHWIPTFQFILLLRATSFLSLHNACLAYLQPNSDNEIDDTDSEEKKGMIGEGLRGSKQNNAKLPDLCETSCKFFRYVRCPSFLRTVGYRRVELQQMRPWSHFLTVTVSASPLCAIT